ncbi:hypothetical protein V1527DRAFT_413452 [Lipomyces starkeyi]
MIKSRTAFAEFAPFSRTSTYPVLYLWISITNTSARLRLDAVYGGYDPQTASGSRASRSVAQIVTSAVNHAKAREYERKPTENVTEAADKRKAVYDIPAIALRRESDLTRNSTPSNDQSEEQGKRLKLDSSRDSTLSATEKSSTMSFTESKDVSPVREHNTNSDYNKALALLRSNTPEQILDVQLPYSKYLQLEKAFSKLNPDSDTAAEKSYPSLSYNSCTETVTVVTVPSNVHEAGVYQINIDIIGYSQNYLSTRSPLTKVRIVPLGSTTMRGFHGTFAKSAKQTDGGVIYLNRNGDAVVTVALEVGKSERYEKLCRDKDIWIDGLGVKVFILVCVNESPQFKRSSTEYEHIEDVEAEIALMKESMAATLESNLLLTHITPFVYRRRTWAGALSTAFIEVWRPNSSPSRYDLIQNGDACDHLPTTLGLSVSDLFPDDAWEATDIPDHEIPFDGRSYLETLMVAMNVTAQHRFLSVIEQKQLDEEDEVEEDGEEDEDEDEDDEDEDEDDEYVRVTIRTPPQRFGSS